MTVRLLAALLFVTACRGGDAPKTDAAATSAAPATKAITRFTKTLPAVGSKRVETSDLAMTMTLAAEGQKRESKVAESVRHTDEVLAVNGDAVSKVRVTFDDVSSTQQATAIKGKTYVVESKDGKIAVRDASDGDKPAPPEEAREVERHFRNLGKPDPMLAAIPANGVTPGEKVDAIANAIIAQLEDSGDAMKAKDVVVTFREARGDEGVFGVALTLEKTEGPTTMSVALKGEASVSTKTGASTKLELAGPVTISGGEAVKTAGSGSMQLKTETRAL